MYVNRNTGLILVLVAVGLLCGLVLTAQSVHAQAPSPDPYESNDSLVAASAVPNVITLPNMTISPTGDHDYWRILGKPAALTVQVIGTPGLDIVIELYDPTNTVVASDNDPAGPNAQISYQIAAEGYYVIHVWSTTALEGWYELRIVNVIPTATPTATVTWTPSPTLTSTPVPTSIYTATPEMGGKPDFAEPNWDPSLAYRLRAGDKLSPLNFNSGTYGQVDNDWFVMSVVAGITYTCETDDLGPAADTNLIVYGSDSWHQPFPQPYPVIGGNDDVDTQQGLVNSRVTWASSYSGDSYILVGYKYPQDVDIRQPGASNYTLQCYSASLATPTPTADSQASGASSGGVGSSANGLPAFYFTEISRPTPHVTPTPLPLSTLTVTVLVAYDENANGSLDLPEGIAGLSVRVIDPVTNQELTHGFTNARGVVQLSVVANTPVRVVIPFLSAAKDFNPGVAQTWELLIPPGIQPGLIP